jgi:hypothetical protein
MKEIFERQLKNNLNWLSKSMFDKSKVTDLDREAVLKDYILLTIDEMVELLRVVNYKQHRPYKKPLVRTNVLEEAVDIFKYLVSILLLYGFTSEEFVEAFYQKSDIVDERWKMEGINWDGEYLLAVDLDGVVADYVSGYVSFLFDEGILGGLVSTEQYTYNIAELYGLDKRIEEKAKRVFQEEGGFAALPCFAGAKDTLIKAKSKGYKIVIITARPYLEVKRIYADTMAWLEAEGIPYDAIYWGKDKADIVFRYLHPAVPVYFIEDRDKHAIELANEGIRVLLMDKPYNRGVEHSNITRVDGWDGVACVL